MSQCPLKRLKNKELKWSLISLCASRVTTVPGDPGHPPTAADPHCGHMFDLSVLGMSCDLQKQPWVGAWQRNWAVQTGTFSVVLLEQQLLDFLRLWSHLGHPVARTCHPQCVTTVVKAEVILGCTSRSRARTSG